MNFRQSFTKHLFRWLALAVLAVMGTALITLLVWNSHRPSRKYARIERGMLYEQIVLLFQVEPGEHRRAPGYMVVPPGNVQPGPEDRDPFELHVWYFDEGIVQILCDREQRVVDKCWRDASVIAPWRPDPRLEQFLRWFGW
jgi:hypothetical protein